MKKILHQRFEKKFIIILSIIILMIGIGLMVVLKKNEKIKDINPKESNPYKSDYSIGVIKSTQTLAGTDITYLDSELKTINTLNYPYGRMEGCSFYVPKVVNGVMYENPLGFGIEKNFGTIIGLDLNDGSVKEYPFNRVNITNYIVTDDYIYTISNLNSVTYIDRYCFKDKTISSVELDGIISMDMALYKRQLYVFAIVDNHCNMYKVDMDLKKYAFEYELTKWFPVEENSPNYSVVYGDNLYLTIGNKVLEYSMKQKRIKEIKLPYKDGWQLLLKGSLLYVSCTDIYDDTDSAIVVLDLKSREILGCMEFLHTINQFDLKGNDLYIHSNNNTIEKYKVSDNYQCTLEHSVKIETKEDYYIGSFFLK